MKATQNTGLIYRVGEESAPREVMSLGRARPLLFPRRGVITSLGRARPLQRCGAERRHWVGLSPTSLFK